jgi:dihydropteroate synthase
MVENGRILRCGRFVLSLEQPRVMGIVNITPDSFSDGGRFLDPSAALAHAEALIEEGADILDLGAESTRPGAAPVSAAEELDRLMPLLERAREWRVPVSVDTMKPEVMHEAVRRGASMINDVTGFRAPGAIDAVVESDAALCVMHMQGEPRTMQVNPTYADVVGEVRAFLAARVDALEQAGVARERIVVDPGFGFGKTTAHNLTLLRSLRALHGLGAGVLAGLSRKSMLGALTGRAATERLPASIAAAVLAVERGADIVRAHDVAATRDALAVVAAVRRSHP